MKVRISPLSCLALAALFASAAARADITIFTDQGKFNASVTHPGTDSFNDLVPGHHYDSLSRSAGGYSYLAAASNSALYGAGSAGDVWLSTNYANDSIIFSNFSGGVNALGGNFFGSDVFGQFSPGYSITLVATDGSTLKYKLGDTTTTSFLGFVSSSPLLSVTVATDGSGSYWPTANNLTLALAAPVPEPATYAMLLAGLTLAGVASRRRR